MAQGMVFEDIFNVKDMDPNGRQFDRGKSLFFSFVTNECYTLLLLTYVAITIITISKGQNSI